MTTLGAPNLSLAAAPAIAERRPAGRSSDLLAALHRDAAADAAVPHAVTDTILAIFTLGFWPLLMWPGRFKRAARADRAALRGLAGWASAHASAAEAARLSRAADAVRFHPTLQRLSWLAALVAVVALLVAATNVPPGQPVVNRLLASSWAGGRTTAGPFHAAKTVWVAALVVGYGAHWLQVLLHAASVRRFLDRFNVLALREGLSPVYLRPFGWGVPVGWIAAGAFLLAMGAPWAVPFAMAGTADRRYRRRSSPTLRAELAEHVRQVVLNNPPAIRAGPVEDGVDARCATPGCGGRLPPAGRFCPRCGGRRTPR